MQYDRIKIFVVIVFLCFLAPLTTRAAGYDFFVDAAADASIADGSAEHPFRTINAAKGHIEREKLQKKKVFIKNGTYSEAVVLANDTGLYGESREGVVIDAEHNNYGVHFHRTSSRLSGVTVKNAATNLHVDELSKATIEDCAFLDARQGGVKVARGKTSVRYKFSFKNSSVKGSGKRGMYIFRRRIEIKNSEISQNEEEGIDLHTNVRGKISGSDVKNNGESGIEMMIAGAKTTLKGNSVSSNSAQGISVQFYDSSRGKVKILKNSVRNNEKYGIRYARYDYGKIKAKFRDFVEKSVSVSGNTIKGNGDGDYSYL